MNEPQLLESAAKAMNFPIRTEEDGRISAFMFDRRWVYWNPLQDDGDAFRLAIALSICVDPDNDEMCCMAEFEIVQGETLWLVEYNPDRFKAARVAIVRAAAMKSGAPGTAFGVGR